MQRDHGSNNINNNNNNHHYWNQKSIHKAKIKDSNGRMKLANCTSTSSSSKWISLQDARILGCEWWRCDGNRMNYSLQYHHITENHNRPVLRYPNGDMYLGGWAKCRSGLDKPQGFGVFVSYDLILLVGQWEQGHLQGYARQLWLPQSNIWRNNYDPLSCIQTDNGIGLPFLYFGTFQHSKKNDLKATVVLKDGTTRIGPWKDDLPVGDWWQDHTKMRTPIWEIKRLLSFHSSSDSISPQALEEKAIHNRNNVVNDDNNVDDDDHNNNNNNNDIDSLVVQDGEIPIRTAVTNRNDSPPPISTVVVPVSTTPRSNHNKNKTKRTKNRLLLDNHHHHPFLHSSIGPTETPKQQQQQQHSIESFSSLQNQSPAVRRAKALLQQTAPTDHIRTTPPPTKTPTSHTTTSNSSTNQKRSRRTRRRRSVLFLQEEEEEQKDDKEDTMERREPSNHREPINNMISQQDYNNSTVIGLEPTLQSKQINGWIGPKRLDVLLRHKQEATFSDIASTLSVHGDHDNDDDDPNKKNPRMMTMIQDEPFQPPSHIMTHESSSHRDDRPKWLQQVSLSSSSPPTTTPRTLSDIAIDGLGTDYLRDRIMVLSSEERDLDFVEIDIRDDFFTISDLDGGDSTTKEDGQQQRGCCSTPILCSHPDSMRGSFHYHQNRLLGGGGGGNDDDESLSNDDPMFFSILGSRQLNNSPSHIVAGYGGEVFDFTTIDSNPIQVESLLRQQQLEDDDEERRGEGLIELETMSSLKSQSCSGGGTSDNHQIMIDDSQKSIGWFGWFGI